MPLQTGRTWLYSQIYFLYPDKEGKVEPLALRAVCDQFIVEVVPGLVNFFKKQRWIEQFFYIRYAEGGYHLRLRFKGDEVNLNGPVQTYFEAVVADFFATQQAPLWPENAVITPARLRESGCLRYAVYEPEIEKYGGIAGLSVAEAHFQMSSQICIEVLAAERQSNISRSQFALELMNILLSEFGAKPHEKAFLLRAYTAYWLSMVQPEYHEQIVTAMEENYQQRKTRFARRFREEGMGALEESWQEKSPNLFQMWRQHLADVLEQLRELDLANQLESPVDQHVAQHERLLRTVPTIYESPTVALLILPNYVHMFNNRLGLTPLQEVQLSYLLYRYLEDTYDAASNDLYTLILEPNMPAMLAPAG